ncbi:DAD/Ost2 domain-containing protein [Rozella allomycis CSF55]|uniref:Dolichyl-diphosphooligosaccharide--protein glycosyltransferase subunit OST2 n=1 Tax=Rozella allomycis (strain CSF55) TaxID=988480 RepID=A0A075APG1_ROZAC|nr:DAD/Ost2 domain-containing protein [Rozella allomycis CSF55]|eukprot:EPZ31928.1 DAD/Ost2 domain-containing protein [Rozella allomycis CSF55]
MTLAFEQVKASYYQNTPWKLKIIDSYLLFCVLTGIIQFVYCALVGTFPYNAFLSGFGTSVGCFVLATNLRFTIGRSKDLQITPERSVADYVLCSILLFAFAIHFAG